MNTTKIFANEDSIVDLSSLGSKSEVKIVISGPDMNVVTPQGTTVIINGALYSSIKGNKLSVKFNDGTVSGSKLVSHIDLQNIKLDRIDSTLVESSENSYKKNNDAKNKAEVEKEKEKLQQKIEEAKKAEEAADKAKNEANKAISEMVEVQNTSKEIENMLSNFLGDIASKDSMAQSSDNQEIAAPEIKVTPQEDDSPILIKPININTGKGRSNSSSKSDHTSDESIPPQNISVSLKLANDSNSGSKNDTLTKVGMPKFIGTTEPNTSIVIKLDEISIDRLVSDSLGNFEFTSPIELDEGNHVFSVEATDESGATGTAKLAITVDKTTILPTFELSIDDKAAAGKNLTAKLTPTIKGIAEKEAVVEVYVGSKLLATASVNKGGEWEYKFKNGELTEGNNDIRLIAIDQADNRAKNTGVIEVDSIPPEKPTITLEPDSNSGLKNDNVTQVKQPTFLGKSEPGAKIELFLGSAHLKDVVADKNGNWSFTHSSELTDDKYTLRVIASDLAGNKSEENSLHFEIDTVISKFNADILDEDDSGITKDNITNVLNPRLTGITEPDCTIEVTNNSTGEIVNISSNKKGVWNVTFLKDSVEGNNNVTFKVTDKADNSDEFFFNYHVDTVPPVVPTAGLNNFVTLPNGNVVTKEELPVFVGTAEPGSTVMIMLAGRADSSVKVSSSGQWEYKVPDKFLDGNYQIDFLAQDAAGNKSPKLNYSFTIQTDTAIPTAELDQADDSGVKGDWITRHQSDLTLTGTAQQYATVKVYIGEKLIGTSVADGAGVWGLDIPQNFPEDKYNIKVVATDKLSFTATQEYQLIIDNFISQPSIQLHDSSDTGIKSDNITKVTMPSFTGQAEANSKITLFVDSILQGETISGSDGVWNISTKSVLGDGNHLAVVEAKDVADNSNKSIEYKFEVISSTTTPTIKLSNDTGLDANDSITNENKPHLIGTSATHARVNILLGTKPVGNVLANEKGEWEYKFSDGQKLDDGKYTLSVWVEDVAGNIAHSANLLIEVDTNISIPTMELSSVTDSGSQGDHLTHFSKPDLLVKNVDADVKVVEVWNKISNTKVGSATYLTEGVWSYTFIDVLPEGMHQFYAKVQDIAGNSADSQPFTLNIDTELTEPTIALAVGEDTGSSASDGLTNKKRPKFDLSAIDQDVDKVTVEVTQGGKKFGSLTAVKSNGQWGVELPTDWDDGNYQLIVSVTDKAGNNKKSAPLAVQVDTELSQPIIELAVGQDTGSDKSDHLTKIETPEFVINTDVDVVTLKVSIDGGKWVDATKSSDGVWHYTPADPLPQGEHKLIAQATDNAGNQTDSQPFTLNIDTELNKPIIALAETQDTGSDPQDNLTNITTPKFVINTDKDVVKLQVKMGNGQWVDATEESAGVWHYTPTDPLPHGEHKLVAQATDKADNQIDSLPFTLNIDTELNKPIIELAVGQDTGSDPQDNLTNIITPKFVINTDKDVVKLQVKIGEGQWVDATKDDDGVWSYTPADPLPQGEHKLIAQATDNAGNQTDSLPFTLNIDTGLNKPIIELAAGQDTGSDKSDNLTNITTPKFVINTDEDVVKLQVKIGDGEWVDATKDNAGSWHYTPADPLPHGEHKLVARATDNAGNQTDSQPFTLNIDTELNKPIIALAEKQDTGSDPQDNLTNITTPKFVINTDKDVVKLQVKMGNGQWVDATEESAGVWHYTPADPLPHGEHKLVARAVDKADNQIDSLPFTLNIDTELTVPTIALAAGEDTSRSKTDGITKNKRPKFALGTIDQDVDKVMVEVIQGGKKFGSLTAVKSNGQWGVELPTDWDDGNYQLIVRATDKAGNNKESAPLAVQVDSNLSQPIIELAEGQDTGRDERDNLTKIAAPKFVINTDVDVHTLKVSIDGGQWVDATKGSDGVWSYTPADPLLHGEHQLVARAADNADNQIDSLTFTLNIDTKLSEPTIVFAAGEETGGSYESGLTKNSSPKFDLNNIDSDADVVKVHVKNMKSGEIDSIDAMRDSPLGPWYFSPSEKWDDGDYQLSVTVEDNAGNKKDSTELNVKLDTALAKPIIEFAKDEDTGSSASDGLTNKKQPTFNFNNVDSDVIDIIVDFVIDGKKQSLSAQQDSQSGKWSFTPTSEWVDGKYQLTARAKDKAGNENSSETLSMEIDTDYEINSITLTNATGGEGYANLTNSSKPEFLFDLPKDTDTVTASLNGAEPIVIKKDNKQWIMKDLTPLKDGDYTLKVQAFDNAGNPAEKELKFIIDTTLAVPTIELGAKQDTGIYDNDGITKNPSPRFDIGKTDPDVIKATVTIGGVEYQAKKDGNNKWFLELETALAANVYDVTVKVEDRAGNTETSNIFNLEVDLSTQVNEIKLLNDNGKHTDDYITSNKTPHFEIDVPDDVHKVEVSLTGKDNDWTTLTKNSQNKWLFSTPKELDDKEYTLSVKVTDIAGNEIITPQKFTVDTALNTPTVNLAPGSDTGTDASDNLTRNSKPEFIISNIDSDYDKVSIVIDGTIYPATKGLAGWSFIPSTALNDGEHTISVTVTDIAGNSRTSSTLTVNIDTQTEIKTIKLVDDSGVSDSDGLTNNTRPSFEIVVPEDVAVVEVSVDGKKWVKAIKKDQQTWSFSTEGVLTDGKYTLQVRVEDKAGNPATKNLDFVIDTDVDGLKIEMPDDTGKKAGAHITNNTMPRFNISAKEPLETVVVEIEGVKTILKKDPGGAWSFTPPGALADGTYQLKVIATDSADNSKTEVLSFDIDTILLPPEIDLMDRDDSGYSHTDNITKVKQPKFIINKVPGDIDKVTIMIDGISHIVQPESDGSYYFTPSKGLSDGDYKAVVTFTDKAGNTKDSTLPFTIDTSTHLMVAMDTASDTGASPSDNITKNTRPGFNITADVGSQVSVQIINKADGKEVYNSTTTMPASGSWNVMPDKLPEGKYTLKVTAKDTTDNTDTQEIPFTVDTTTINPTIALVDHSPNDNSEALSLFPEFKGVAEALSSVLLRIDDVIVDSVTADANGTWSWKPKTAMQMGDRIVSVIATDIAGNESPKITIDVKIPYLDIKNPTIKLDDASDTGVLGDFITKHQQPTITGVTIPNAKVAIYLNNKNIDSVVANSSGYYSYTLPQQLEGDYSLKVGIEDPRDSQELLSPEVQLIIDTHVEDISWSVEGEQEGGYINTSTPVVTGRSEPGSKITILVNGVKHEEVTTSEAGTWKRLLPDLGADGEYTVTIEVKDIAGNEDTFGPKILTVDTKNDILSVALKETDDTGIKKDNLTNKSDVTLEGQAEPGATLTISGTDGKTIKTLTVDSSGNWNSEVTLSEGNNTFTVKSVDKAGNPVTKDISIERDTSLDISDISLQKSSNSGDTFDLVTKDKSPVLQAMTDPYASVEVMINGKSHGIVKADSTGLVKFTLPENSSDGEYQVLFIATDVAGNEKKSNVATVIIDSDISQFEVNNIPGITSERALPISGKGEPGATVEVFVDGVLANSVIVEKDGTWSTSASLKKEGLHNIKVKISDVADNAKESDSFMVELDTEMTRPTIQLAVATNSGATDDVLTKNKKPILTGTAEAGSTVSLLLDDTVFAEVKVDDTGNWSYQYEDELKDGEYYLRATAKDLAGNSETSKSLTMIIDSTTFIDSPQMLEGQYKGIDSDITVSSIARPGFYLKGEPGQEVEVFVDGQSVGKTVATPNYQTYKLPVAVADGRHTIYYVIKDKAGNEETSKEVQFMVDTSNTTPVTMDTINGVTLDSIVAQYGKHYIREMIPNMIFSGKAEADSQIQIKVNGLMLPQAWVDNNGVMQDKTWTDKDGVWSRPIDIVNYKDGKLTIEIISTDRGGHTQIGLYDLIIDTDISEFTCFLKDNKASDEISWLSGEDVTVMHGKGEVGAQVSLKLGGEIIKSVTVGADGIWEISTDKLPTGESKISLSIEDNAGHSKEVSKTILIERGTLEAVDITDSEFTANGRIAIEGTAIGAGWVYFDDMNGKRIKTEIVNSATGAWSTYIPYQPDGKVTVYSKSKLGSFSEKTQLDLLKEQGVITLDTDSDKGILGDNMTSDTKPTFIISGIDTDVISIVLNINGNKFGATKIAADQWAYTPDSELTHGKYTITATLKDSNNEATSKSYDFIIDTELTKPTIELDVVEGQNIATDGNDTLIRPSQPGFIIKNIDKDVSEVMVSVSYNGTSLSTDSLKQDINGDWRFTAPGEWQSGHYQLSVEIKDNAGNIKVSDLLYVVIVPQASITDIELIDNAGKDATDNLTKDKLPQFNIAVSDGVKEVLVSIDKGTTWDSATPTVNAGIWHYSQLTELAHGQYQLMVKATDKMNGKVDKQLEFTIDSELTQPTIELEAGQNPVADDNDNLIRKSQPGFIIKNIDADVSKVMVSISRDGTDDILLSEDSLQKDIDGSWHFTAPEEWETGRYQLVVNIEDKAGNTETSELLSVVIVPEASITDIELINNTGNDSTGNLTKDKLPQFNIAVSGDVNEVLVSIDNGTKWDSATRDIITGIWHYSQPTELAHGQYQLMVKVIDKIDDKVSKQLDFSIDAEVTQPTIELNPGEDNGNNATDNVTDKSQPESQINPVDTTQTSGASLVMKKSVDESQFAELDFKPLSHESQEDEYRITLLESSENGSVTQLQRPEFEISVPKDVTSVTATLDDREYQLTVVDQKALLQADMPSEDGKYTLEVKFIDKDASFIIKDKEFTIDNSSDEIIKSMAGTGKAAKEAGASGSTSGQHGHDISEIFTNSTANYIAPIDEVNDYY